MNCNLNLYYAFLKLYGFNISHSKKLLLKYANKCSIIDIEGFLIINPNHK